MELASQGGWLVTPVDDLEMVGELAKMEMEMERNMRPLIKAEDTSPPATPRREAGITIQYTECTLSERFRLCIFSSAIFF